MRVREATMEDSAAMARILVDTWQQAYVEIMPADFLAGLSYEVREKRIREGFMVPDPNRFLVIVEEENSAVVGCMVGGACRDESETEYSGEVYALYVLPAYQHRGIGAALIRTAIKRLLAMGCNSMLIWTLAQNPSRGFYEALGGSLVRKRKIEIGGVMYPEVGYGWTDLKRLEKTITD